MKKPVIITVLACFLSISALAEEIAYTVEKGDTFYSIAHEYGISPAALMEANDIDDPTKLSVGARLIIPQVYVAEKGDTLWGIAHAFGLTVYELRDLNGFPEGYADLKEGDTVVVPVVVVQNATDDEESQIVEETPDSPVNTSEPSEDTKVATVAAVDASEKPYWPHNGIRRDREGKMPGLEFVGNKGDLVYAVRTGTVVWNAPYRPFDWVIIIESDDDYQFVYGITDAVLVKINDRITAGAEIGTLGQDPSTGEALLFFTVLKDGKVVDPELAPRG